MNADLSTTTSNGDTGDDVSRLLDAARFAADRHRHQRRKDVEATPYINHPLAVAGILVDAGIEDVDVLVAALLHDTVEDTETTSQEIADRFGDRVANLVAEVTDNKSLPKAERKRLQIATTASKSPGARLIKQADKIANLRDIAEHPPQWDEQRLAAYRRFAADVIAQARGVSQALDALGEGALDRKANGRSTGLIKSDAC